MKNSEIIKYKRHTSEKKKILNLFKYLLDTILTDKTLKLKSQNDKTLMSSNEDNENENEKTFFNIFKLDLAHLSNIIEKKIFEKIFGHTFETLANKLITTTNKEEYQTIVNNINENKEKLYEQTEDEMSDSYDYVI